MSPELIVVTSDISDSTLSKCAFQSAVDDVVADLEGTMGMMDELSGRAPHRSGGLFYLNDVQFFQ